MYCVSLKKREAIILFLKMKKMCACVELKAHGGVCRYTDAVLFFSLSLAHIF